MSRAARYAGRHEVFNALVGEGFPVDVASLATINVVPPDDAPDYLGWTKHVDATRAYAMKQIKSRLETIDFNNGQARQQLKDHESAYQQTEALLARLSQAPASLPGVGAPAGTTNTEER